MKILIVDDSRSMIKILTNSLNEAGYHNLASAKDGKEALETLKADSDINFICSDWNMPEMSGIDFLKAVKANENFKKIPFLMCTSRSHRDDIIEAIQNGAANYIVKPFTSDTIKSKIEEILSKLNLT